jgi:hypothetical protein
MLLIAGYSLYHHVQQDNKAHLIELQQQAQQKSVAADRQYTQSKLDSCIKQTGINSYPALTLQQYDILVARSGYAGLDAYLSVQKQALEGVQYCRTEYSMSND